MGKSVSEHPAAEQLRAFNGGSLSDEAAVAAISLHLDACPECLKTLEGMSGDTLESLVHSAQRSRPLAVTSSLANAATADLGAGGEAGAEADELGFLTPPQAPDEIGRLGQYRILKVLGKGGMGMVFQAEDLHLERRVALKVMLRDVARRADARERFLREAKLAAAIEHDNIVPIFQVGEANGVPFLAMPWLKGMSLEDRLKKVGKLPIPQVLRLGRQIAQGLAAAHARGLVHRDIKPANLWIEPEQGGRIKILDFGLARVASGDASAPREQMNLTQSGAILGTPAYMAPEQAQAQPVGPACDLFSLGVVLYRLCTGHLPFKADNMTGLLVALVIHDPTPPHDVDAEVPQTLSDLIMKLLVKDPALRLASATEVAKQLQRLEREFRSADTEFQKHASEPEAQAKDQNKPEAQGKDTVSFADTSGSNALAASASSQAPPPAARKRRPALFVAVAAGLLLLLGSAYAIFQIGFQTPQGMLIVKIDDKDIEARFKNGQLQLLGPDGKVKYSLTPSQYNKELPTGPYKIKVTGADGLTVDVPEFVMKDGDRITVHVVLETPAVAANPGTSDPPRPGKTPTDRSAAEWVLSIGGDVILDVNGKVVRVTLAKDLPAGTWKIRDINLVNNQEVTDLGLKELAGLTQLQMLILNSTQITDAGLKELAGLTQLQTLILNGTKVSGGGLKNLARLTQLQMLGLGATPLTDAGLKELAKLAGLTQLQTLSLNNTQVTDAGLKELAGLTQLKKLNLHASRVTDAGLKDLAGLTQLKTLNLDHNKVTDEGLKELAGLTQLQELTFGGTQVTDAGLKELAGLTQLQMLHLSNTTVTDAGLKELAKLTQLKTLNLSATKVTDAGVATLKKALPKCQVNWLPTVTDRSAAPVPRQQPGAVLETPP